MRKYIIAFISIIAIGAVVLLFTLRKEKMSEYEGLEEVYTDCLGLHVYRNEDKYTVLIANNEYVGLKAVFSLDRELSYSKGFEPLEDQDFEIFIGQSLNDVETILGEYHHNHGSGMFYPSYITQNGYLVVFCLESGDIINGVFYVDLLTGDGSVSSVD